MGNDASRANLIETITDLVAANNYDGIDLDFEGFAFVDGNIHRMDRVTLFSVSFPFHSNRL